MKAAVAAGVVCTAAAAVVVYARWRRQRRQHNRRVLVVGSINVDLYQRTDAGAVRFGGESVRHTELEPRSHRPTHEQGRTITGRGPVRYSRVRALSWTGRRAASEGGDAPGPLVRRPP